MVKSQPSMSLAIFANLPYPNGYRWKDTFFLVALVVIEFIRLKCVKRANRAQNRGYVVTSLFMIAFTIISIACLCGAQTYVMMTDFIMYAIEGVLAVITTLLCFPLLSSTN
ncbi:Uncharacterised protein family, transmembrane-17 like protein [Aduncisulcus paluster]|uniref:Uncharacterized protein n=1 Tax=Aduncisulcus paluster TaxID=2918883 RepID=A0ABQ5JSQ0_9EUKA|nr:Uncharacterised protein family, transmembrane-17 like protein [Aduncisulcus paluster]